MGSIVHRSVPTNLKGFPTCSHAHALFQDRFKDVQVGSRCFIQYTVHPLTQLSQTGRRTKCPSSKLLDLFWPSRLRTDALGPCHGSLSSLSQSVELCSTDTLAQVWRKRQSGSFPATSNTRQCRGVCLAGLHNLLYQLLLASPFTSEQGRLRFAWVVASTHRWSTNPWFLQNKHGPPLPLLFH